MPLSVAIFLFPEVEVLDFAGPFEVFTTASRVFARGCSAPPPFQVFTVAESASAVRARAGLTVAPDFSLEQHPIVDVLVVPGGVITAELAKPVVIRWIQHTAAAAQVTASVCTGAFLLAKAGLLDGRRATTHWEDSDELRAMFPAVTVDDALRWIDDGGVVTSAGISAGMDMSLHLVARLAGRELARQTARQIDYDWREQP